MANQQHLDILIKHGVQVWNRWREKHPQIRPDLTDAILQGATLNEIDLSEAYLTETRLIRADLSGADLSRAILKIADLSGSILREAKLTGTYLDGAHLMGADLRSATLGEATLRNALLRDALLSGAILRGADLSGAILRGADLRGADLSRAILVEADLSGAILRGAGLGRADLRGADLRGTDLGGVRLGKTAFAENDLRAVKGLVEIDHLGPSHVELHTVKLPQDGSALHFLQGAGVPNEWIEFYRSSMMMPIQYHSCFISYAYQDEVLAQRLHADLQDYGVRCWFAPKDLKIGDHYHQRIDESIHLYDKLILILSEHAIQSAWVEREVMAAREKEDREQRLVLFPIRLDSAVMDTAKAWAADVRRRWHIGDFTQWKNHDSYQGVFKRLLDDLKTQK